MPKCPLCGAPTRQPMPKDIPIFVKKVVKIERELSNLSPAEVASGLIPLTLPIALETAEFITDWLERFKHELERR